MKHFNTKLLLAAAAPLLAGALHAQTLLLEPIGTYATGLYGQSAAEIVDYDASSFRVYSTNSAANSVDVIDVSDPTNPTLLLTIDISPYGGSVNSVVVLDGAIATAVEAFVKTDNGSIVFFDLDGNYINQLTVGALPDMVTKTPDGTRVLVANEGEPISYLEGIDPVGSVSVINITGGIASLTQANVTTIGFEGYTPEMLPGVRIYGPNASVAQDMEPEYITVSEDSQTAFVVCQENNAVVRIDLNTNTIVSITSLGLKDHSLPGNGLDASDQDGAINIATWPVKGVYMPDAITSYTVNGQTYVVYANEGDARDDWPGYTEGRRIGNAAYQLDPVVFPNAAFLKQNTNLGRLTASKASGDLDNDGFFEEIHVLGSRSFSIRDAAGNLVYDSGDDFEQITAARYPSNFNASNSNNSFDNRSDDKGPEPEAVEVAIINGHHYAFIGLERIGGIMVYEISDPAAPYFVTYVNNRDFSGNPLDGTGLDSGVENLRFVPAAESPNGQRLLISSNEVSGTVTIFSVDYLLCEPGNGIVRERRSLPQGPITIQELDAFEAPMNDGEQFTATLSGIICPPVSGYYRFLIAADQRAALYLSNTAQPGGNNPIAGCPAPVAPHVYDVFPTQSSAPIWLDAGELRHLRVVHRETFGTDHVSVAWERADGVFQDPIPGHFFNLPFGNRSLALLEEGLVEAIEEVQLFPNPAQDMLTIRINAPTDGTIELFVIDQLGRTVMTRVNLENNGDLTTLDVRALSPGVYSLHVLVGDQRSSTPFVVVR
jgi:hypothetical protein